MPLGIHRVESVDVCMAPVTAAPETHQTRMVSKEHGAFPAAFGGQRVWKAESEFALVKNYFVSTWQFRKTSQSRQQHKQETEQWRDHR